MYNLFSTLFFSVGSGTYSSLAHGVNSYGDVVGTWDAGGYLLTASGTLTSITYPSATATQIWDINDLGNIVGFYTDTSSVTHGFLYGSSFTSIDYPSSTATYVYGISNGGIIVGSYLLGAGGSGQMHGFVLDNGVFTTIDMPISGAYTIPSGINDNGQIVGNYLTSHGHGFLYDGTTYTTIDYVGTVTPTDTTIQGINNAGMMIGTYAISGVDTGFTYDGTTFTDIPILGMVSSAGYGINDKGTLVGAGGSTSGAGVSWIGPFITV